MNRIKNHALFIVVFLLISFVFCGCAEKPTSSPTDTETTAPLSTDEEFLRTLSSALMARWDADDAFEYVADYSLREDISNRSNCIKIELQFLQAFVEKDFDDATLGELVQQYITLLKASERSLDYAEDDLFKALWAEIYYQRCILLKQFADDYGLTVDSEHQPTLDNIVSEGQIADGKLEDLYTDIATYCYEQVPYSIEVIDDGLLSVRVGTPEFQQAVRFVVPHSAYDNAENGDEKISLIHDYLDGHEYMSRYFTVSDNGDISIELVNIIEFVHDCQATGLFYGENESDFGLTEEVESIYSFSQTLDITESVAIAMLHAIDTVSYNWDESIACEVLALPGYEDFLS